MKCFLQFFLILSALAMTLGLALNQLRDKPLELLYKDKKERLGDALTRIQEGKSNEGLQPPQRRLQTVVALPETLDHAMMIEIAESGVALILDARPELFYRLGHIPNALSLPRDEFEKNYMAMKETLEKDKNRPLVLYCADSSCKDANLVFDALKKLGYTRVSIYTGGWKEWRSHSVTNDK